MNYLYTYLLSLPILLAIDFLWIGYLAKDLYTKNLTPVINLSFNLPAGVVFYVFYMVGIIIFATYPGIVEKDIFKTILLGALFGFFCYSTYDLTNLATIKDWPIKIVIIDILWGTVLTTFIATIAYKIFFWF